MPSFSGVKAVVLDIVLAEKWDDADFTPYKNAFPEEARQSREAFEQHVQDLTARDVKVAYLKGLQGFLFQTLYASGAVTTPFYADVAPALHRWTQAPHELTLAIYSSGSIAAQKLLFSHASTSTSTSTSTAPSPTKAAPSADLTPLLTHYFDTTTAGPKTAPESYLRIADALARPPHQLLFLSDSIHEVRAARAAGWLATVVVREGNAAVVWNGHEERESVGAVRSLDEVVLRGGS
ncbi:MAG: hypothetical protein M1819_007120 [Sarea resinae]|nr:MAG: hypothetical protein M1819_007120 [Sarea resinae]